MKAVLRASMESGDSWDDPSEDLIFELLGDIERGDEEFMVIDRLSDKSGQTYAQVTTGADNKWIVERRDGSPDRHYRATCADLRAAHEALTAWAFDLDGWQKAADWRRVDI